jgi:hypothetical protein
VEFNAAHAALPSDDSELALFKREFPELLLALNGGGFKLCGGTICTEA